jgi:hypothetical protein
MPQQSLQSFVEALACRADDWVDETAPVVSFKSRPAPTPGYVWPDVDTADEPLAPILLIRSSGAMGKSCAAASIARELRAPLVDLANSRVGEDSLTGLLARALGWGGAAKFTTELHEGRRCLVLDGLDEAQLLVGKESYLAFLTNVLELVDRDGPPAQLIAFGRHDAVETAQIAVMDRDQTASLVALLPLSSEQSHQLMDATLDLDEDYDVHRRFRQPWCELRDTYVAGVAHALLGHSPADDGSDWDDIGDFLGYPPVVLAIAESLKVDNPAAEIAAIGASTASEIRIDRGRLLKQIVERVMSREQLKVSSSLGKALDLDDATRKLLYLPEEQIVRCIAASTGWTLEATPPQSIPEDKRARYEEQISPWVVDHPFLLDRKFANVAFRDFVRAYVATSPLAEIFGIRRSELVGACGHVGPFFAHFVHALTAPADSSSGFYGCVSEDLVDDLIKSNALGTDTTPMAEYVHRGSDSPHLRIGERYARRPAFGFHIDDPSGVLMLKSPLSYVFVDTEHSIVIESTEQRIDLGPGVVVFARELQLGGSTVVAYPGRTGDPDDESPEIGVGAILACAEPAEHAADLSVKSHSASALFVTWPQPSYQWRPFLLPEAPNGIPSLSRHSQQRLLHALRRLLTGFRSGGEPWMYYERYDNFVVGSSPLLVAVRDALLGLGVVKRSADHYSLDLERLGEYGVNYAAMRKPDWPACLVQLAVEVLKDEAVAGAL